MATPVIMPVLSLTMEEGTVAEWLKDEGEAVARDEPLLMVEMDKGTVEVPAPAAGVVRRIVVQPGTTVPVRTVIAEIGAPGEELSAAGGPGDLSPAQAASAEAARTDAASARAEAEAGRTGASGRSAATAAGAAANASTNIATARPGERVFASPRARMRARALGVDLAVLRGSGPSGRIVEADVLAHRAAPPDESRLVVTPLARRLAQERGVALADVRGSGPGGRVTQEDVLRAAATRPAEPVSQVTQADMLRAAATRPAEPVSHVTQDDMLRAAASRPAEPGVQPLSRIRRITAERMAASARAAARVSLFLDADFTEAVRFRQQLEPEFNRLGVARLPWDAIVARAAALGLAEHRHLLAQWVDGQGLRIVDAVDVGVAVTLEPEGLVVPVLRQADRRSLRELAAELLELVSRARAGRLSPAEMQGGSFSITNLGAYRIDGFTPILNPPETAILGVGRIAERPVAVDGGIVARTMCTLSLSFDHRVVDGAPAAAFLARVAELLERPYALLGI
ncbi:MAG: 2-oxo acid dehydrogenase subunit E2 [Chloroflexi bacterium]|nr:2-oxo acid dehydrogenase subunit E2 [Chloroflexota bacterium]